MPGSETVTLTGQTIDKLIRAGDGDAALLYLYILKTHGQKTSSEAAIALDKSKGWIASAMAVLSQLGLVQLDSATGAEVNTADKTDATGSPPAQLPAPGDRSPLEEPRQYTESEVTQVVLSGSDFSIIIDETQRRLGKILSPEETIRLYGIYDYLRLPPEVILQLITHCINECRVTGDGRAPSVRYIERAAYKWEREGIFTLERAEEYLKALESRKSVRGRIKKTLQIKGREFSATEKYYVDDWIDMGFEPEAIAIAYDKTVVQTGNMNWKYIDKIIKSWHNKGLHTAQEVTDMDKPQRYNTKGGYPNTSAQKHGVPNREEIKRAELLLDKIKKE